MNMFKPHAATTPEEYIASLEGPRRAEVQQLYDMIRAISPPLKPYMIAGLIGFGTYHYKYASGREGDWCIIGLSSRKNYISVLVMKTDILQNNIKITSPKQVLVKAAYGSNTSVTSIWRN